jgi:hypothetical protein
MLPELKRLAGRLLHARAARPAATRMRVTSLDEIPYHCGDHWQNLLASPMDARHYVLEDWGDTAGFDAAAAERLESYGHAGIHLMRKRQA